MAERLSHQTCLRLTGFETSVKTHTLTVHNLAAFRKQWIVRLDDAVDYAKHLAAGALSSVVCRTALAPLERLKLEMVLHRRQGMRRLAREIATTEGLLGFWKGNAINCLRTAPHKVCTGAQKETAYWSLNYGGVEGVLCD